MSHHGRAKLRIATIQHDIFTLNELLAVSYSHLDNLSRVLEKRPIIDTARPEVREQVLGIWAGVCMSTTGGALFSPEQPPRARL